jgi:hypothetical protein
MTAWLSEALTGPRVVVRACEHTATSEQYGLPQGQYEFRL